MYSQNLIDRLISCPKGNKGWRDFENICVEILIFLFVPPLTRPRIQSKTLSGIERRDAIFPNRNFNNINIWGNIFQELNARFILCEFKNYEKQKINITEVNQVRNYLSGRIGKFGIIISTRGPSKNALRLRNKIYREEGKVIIFIYPDNLREMIYRKDRGEDPADLIMDIIEDFYLEYE